MPLLQLAGVCKSYGAEPAVSSLDLSVDEGESLVLLGPSGCGKSTLLRMIAGLETPDSGHILLDGRDITALPPNHRPVNMMFQSYALFPHLSVRDNIAFGLRREGLPASEISARTAEAMAMLEIASFATRKPHQLSGGQQQRVALARALVKRPRMLLLDEPLGALDKRLRQQTQAELRKLNRQTGIAFVFVTHDNDEAMALADRIAVMDHGRFRQLDAPRRIYDRPIDRFVAGLMAETNLFNAAVESGSGGLVAARCGILHLHYSADHERPTRNGRQELSLRPEQIEISREPLEPMANAAANIATGIISDIDYIGDMTGISVRLDDGQVLKASQLNALHEPLLELDQQVWLSWESDALVPLRSQGVTARKLGLLALPLLWTAVFVVVPLLLILKISFAEAQLAQPPYTPLFQDGALAVSLINYSLLLEDALYLRALGNSLLYAGLATFCCLILGLAIARAVTQAPNRWQPFLLTLIILPFWTSFLIRVYAWIALLKPEGLINAALLSSGVIDQPLVLVNTGFGVVLGMTYSYLPFAILPIYASLAGQSPRLTEAAIDLGATPIHAFWLVTVPLARPGILAAGLMVFIPMAGEFVIPDLLGGSATIMMGQTLWTEFFSNRDWPLASALAVLLTLLLLVPAMTLQRLELGKASR